MDSKLQGKYSSPSHDSADTVGEAIPARKPGERYTYADLQTWSEDERWELIDGIPYAMSSPTAKHQTILIELATQLNTFLKGKPCTVFIAPFDVRLNADTSDDTVLQPDVLVICDREKISTSSCIGAPDLTVEILSPSTAIRDMVVKLNLYKKYGVREYWIIDPESKTVSVYILDNGRYYITAYAETGTLPVHILEGCDIDLTEVFTEIQ